MKKRGVRWQYLYSFLIVLSAGTLCFGSGPVFKHGQPIQEEFRNVYSEIDRSLSLANASNAAENIVQETINTSSATIADTFTSTGFSVSITPTSSSSRVRVSLTATVNCSSTTTTGQWTLYRNDATELSGNSNGFINVRPGSVASASERSPIHIEFIDSPSTTSATTYTVYQKSTLVGDTITFNEIGVGVLIAEEIR